MVQIVPARVVGRDRTFCSAVALRNWFAQHQMDVSSFNIITEGAHARRSRLLFEKAFGPNVKIGVLAVPSPEFDESRWWRFSEGIRAVVGEGLAYVYARIFFHPSLTEQTGA